MIKVESFDLQRLATGSKAFGKPLRAATRRNLLATGKVAANASKAKIRSMPVKGETGYRQGQLRADIAKAITVSATINSARGAQVRVYIRNTAALKEHRRFRAAQLLDKGQPFRHRIYGTDVWRNQNPYAYFRQTMYEYAPLARRGMQEALLEATKLTLPHVH